MANGPEILIVDDDEVSSRAFAMKLRKQGLQATCTGDPEECLAHIQGGLTGLVVLDIVMPKISGIELLRRIREHHSSVEMPVIMMTAKNNINDIVEALEIGANDYLTKPVHPSIAIARVRTQLSLQMLYRDNLKKKEIQTINEMIVTYNHEINNPLAAAIGLVDLSLERGDLALLERTQQELARIASITKKISEIGPNGITREDYTVNRKMIRL